MNVPRLGLPFRLEGDGRLSLLVCVKPRQADQLGADQAWYDAAVYSQLAGRVGVQGAGVLGGCVCAD